MDIDHYEGSEEGEKGVLPNGVFERSVRTYVPQLREDDKGDGQTRTAEGQYREGLLSSDVGVEPAQGWEMATFVPDLDTRFGLRRCLFPLLSPFIEAVSTLLCLSMIFVRLGLYLNHREPLNPSTSQCCSRSTA